MMEELKDFIFRRYRFRLEVLSDIVMPKYKGSTIRGALLTGFKDTVCINRIGKRPGECSTCPVQSQCSFFYLFEATRDGVMPPIVIEPPLETKQMYSPGEEVEFSIVLIGHRAIASFGFFLLAIRNHGPRWGLGGWTEGKRGKYRLIDVSWVGPSGESEVVYSAESDLYQEKGRDISFPLLANFDRLKDKSVSTVQLHFVTPLLLTQRINGGKRFVSKEELDAFLLLDRLVNRIETLHRKYCGGNSDKSGDDLLAAAHEVRLEDKEGLYWQRWRYRSSRQGQWIELGGLLGTIRLSGDLKPFMPYLVLGEQVHFGKATTYGQGQYQIKQFAILRFLKTNF